MSEHVTLQSNWTTKQKTDYWDRRNKRLRGQTGAVTVHRVVKDEEDKEQMVPLGNRVSSTLSRGKTSGARAAKREQWKAFNREQRKGSTKGE